MRFPPLIAALVFATTAMANSGGTSSLPGQFFGPPPEHIGPLLHDPPEPTLDRVRMHMEAHDVDAALWEASRVTDEPPWARDRDAAWMVRAMLHRERGEHNLASAAFTRVRAGRGPLAEMGTFYEAEQDLARGRYWVAARECEAYRKRNPDGRYLEQCHRIQAVAYAKAGAWRAARQTAEEYDEVHDEAPITEQVELTLTLGALEDDPESMIPRLQEHAIDFRAALTGTIAEEKLAELREQGFQQAVIPDDIDSQIKRAYSLRYTKQTDLAWQAFERLAVESEDDPKLRSWVEDEAIPFGWRTRNWDFLVKYYRSMLAEEDRSDYAWSLFRALSRGGRFKEATIAAEEGLERHAKTKHWRRKHEEFGKIYMLDGDYENARRHYDLMAKRGGWTGLRGSYFAAFAAYMLKDDADATTRFDALIEANGAYVDGALYWRARIHDRAGDTEAARNDRLTLALTHSDSWYGVLAAATLEQDPLAERRTGRWTGDPAPLPPRFEGVVAQRHRETVPMTGPASLPMRPAAAGFASLLWGATAAEPVPRARPLLLVDPNLPPNIGLPTSLFDRARATATIGRWTNRHKSAWDELRAAYDLARAGLYDLSGPLFSAVYEEWRKAYKSSHHPKHYAARRMKLQPDEWREVFNYVGDHHHAARYNHSWWTTIEDPDLRVEARRVGYPLAHARYVWEHARSNGIDPYLVLGLMRQESTYNSIARSRVGARGAMQIMPRTGHLLANIKRDADFTAGDLDDPIFAVGYGIDYLGMLMERFDGVYPLAIASYNGGPFNVSTWLTGTGRDMPMDELVEHIPYRETRNYVKKVSAGYATYLTLYAPEGTLLDPHMEVRADKAEVVDF